MNWISSKYMPTAEVIVRYWRYYPTHHTWWCTKRKHWHNGKIYM